MVFSPFHWIFLAFGRWRTSSCLRWPLLMACTLTGLRRVWFLNGLFFYGFFCKFLNSSCKCKPLPSRRGQWWRWRMLLTSSLGALGGPGLLFFRPWRNYAPQLHHWGRNLFPDPSSSFQDPKAPILYWIFRSQFGFQIGVPVFSVTICWVECSGIICNLGI